MKPIKPNRARDGSGMAAKEAMATLFPLSAPTKISDAITVFRSRLLVPKSAGDKWSPVSLITAHSVAPANEVEGAPDTNEPALNASKYNWVPAGNALIAMLLYEPLTGEGKSQSVPPAAVAPLRERTSLYPKATKSAKLVADATAESETVIGVPPPLVKMPIETPPAATAAPELVKNSPTVAFSICPTVTAAVADEAKHAKTKAKTEDEKSFIFT